MAVTHVNQQIRRARNAWITAQRRDLELEMIESAFNQELQDHLIVCGLPAAVGSSVADHEAVSSALSDLIRPLRSSAIRPHEFKQVADPYPILI